MRFLFLMKIMLFRFCISDSSNSGWCFHLALISLDLTVRWAGPKRTGTPTERINSHAVSFVVKNFTLYYIGTSSAIAIYLIFIHKVS